MLKKEDYEELRKEILEWTPKEIIDAHVHTATKIEDIPEEKLKLYPLSYSLMKDRELIFKKQSFECVFPGKKMQFVGLPLPSPYENLDPDMINNMMITEMKKGITGTIFGPKGPEKLQEAIDKAKKKNVKFKGIKYHPRNVFPKDKKEVTTKDMFDLELLPIAEKEKLVLIIDLGCGLRDEDVKMLRHINDSFNIKIVLPHTTYGYKGFVLSNEEYTKTFTTGREEFEEDFKKIEGCENIFLDASMVIDKRKIEAGMDILGEDKILYGSDFPFGFTPKIRENRPESDVVGEDLKKIIDLKPFEDRWKYDYNIYLMIKALKDAEKALNLDIAKQVMFKNAKKVFML